MEKHASKGTLLGVLFLLGACATSTTAPEAIEQLNADAHGPRLEAVRELGRSGDPHAGEALVALLDESIPDAAEREETWLEVTRSLHQLAEKGLVGEEALPVLDRLAAQAPTAMRRGSGDGAAQAPSPRFPYDRSAADAARAIRLQGARHSKGRDDGDASGRTQADFLAELAWIQPVDGGDDAHAKALADLLKLGVDGITPSRKLLGQVRPQSRGDMAAYFVELHHRTGDQRCVRALVQLAHSRHEDAWRPALIALREMGDVRASEELVEQLQADGVPGDEHTCLTVAALGGIGSDEAIPFLAGLFGHGSREVARAAAYAVTDIGEVSVPAVTEQMQDIGRQNRLMAALAFSRLRDPHGREAARRFLNTARSDDEETIEEIRSNLVH